MIKDILFFVILIVVLAAAKLGGFWFLGSYNGGWWIGYYSGLVAAIVIRFIVNHTNRWDFVRIERDINVKSSLFNPEYYWRYAVVRGFGPFKEYYAESLGWNPKIATWFIDKNEAKELMHGMG